MYFKWRRLYFLAVLLASLPKISFGQSSNDTCEVGVFISSIYDLDYLHQSFTVEYWLWTLSDTALHHSLSSLEFPNAKLVTISHPDNERRNSLSWSTEQCRSTVIHQWNTLNFPFDAQTLHVVIEEADKTSDKLSLAVDSENTKLSNWIALDGWTIFPIKAHALTRTYATTYGDPDLKGSSNYSAVELDIHMKRNGIGLFFKLFSGVYIAFAIAMMVFFFQPTSEVRYSLAVGALFAAVANKYIIDSLLPATVGFTLVDKIHVITFLYILGVVMFSGIALHLQHIGKHSDSDKLDKRAMWLLLFSYVAINAFFILRATLQA